MKQNGVQYHPKPELLWIRFSNTEVENVFGKKKDEIGLHANIVSGVLHTVKKGKKRWKKGKSFSASVADIDKTLNVKPKIKFKTIILEQYWCEGS